MSDQGKYLDMIAEAFDILEGVPDEVLAVALREHPAMRRIIEAEKKNSAVVKRGLQGGHEIEVKFYFGDDSIGRAMINLQAQVDTLAAMYGDNDTIKEQRRK